MNMWWGLVFSFEASAMSVGYEYAYFKSGGLPDCLGIFQIEGVEHRTVATVV